MRSSPLAIALAVSLCAPAFAAARKSVALHPLVVVGGEGDHEKLRAAFASLAASLNLEPADPALIGKFLTERPNHSCAGDDACLAALARSTGASRTLLVSVSPYSPDLVLTGKLVSASGAVLQEIPEASYPKSTGPAQEEVVRHALSELLARIELDTPEPASSPSSSAFTLRQASYLIWGAGAASAAAAAIVLISAQGDREKLAQRLDPNGQLPDGDAEALALHQSLRSRSSFSTGLWIGSAVAAAAGAALFFLAPDPPVSASALITPSGAYAFASVRF